jgi:hypothetical protein
MVNKAMIEKRREEAAVLRLLKEAEIEQTRSRYMDPDWMRLHGEWIYVGETDLDRQLDGKDKDNEEIVDTDDDLSDMGLLTADQITAAFAVAGEQIRRNIAKR